jgi:deazaflavin-dependent oxidoreductase (nitroreductase family)
VTNRNRCMPKINPLLRTLLHIPIYLYRWKLGWMLGKRFLLLTHTGRRTARRHETVLEVMEYRPAATEFVVMSGFGPTADWFQNIQVGPASVEVGRIRFSAAHRILGEGEAVAVVQQYERRNRFIGTIVRSVLRRLLGWNYTGTDSDRHRLVAQLPLVAFRPTQVMLPGQK